MGIRLLLAVCLSTTLWSADAPRIAATIYPHQQLARMVIEQPVGVLIDAAAGCPHDHALTTAERAAIEATPLIIANGAGLDEVVTRLMSPTQVLLDTSLAIPAADRLAGHDDHDGHDHGGNPHFFTSPRQAARIVRWLGERLAEHQPDTAVAYRRRATEAADRLNRLADDIQAAVAPLPRRAVVLQHDSLAYFARDAGLTVVAVIQEEPGHDPSAAVLASLVTKTKAHRAVVIIEPQYPSDFGKVLAQEAGSPLAILDPVASGPANAPLDHYERTMRTNLERLVTALRTP